jgi:hypothetical protein
MAFHASFAAWDPGRNQCRCLQLVKAGSVEGAGVGCWADKGHAHVHASWAAQLDSYTGRGCGAALSLEPRLLLLLLHVT